ncbi:hypothetical protein HMPREF3213_00619 [Heyndrickxia coagulans]|uniref:Uncharacterized protein n=1 Tax=Heyndrickxia coagulans TaxID=1398 RepID=A0A133KZ98_HEYCO|nr:hypothetical protein HMPREF3213_00619 [Heyndrickxia coagulans]
MPACFFPLHPYFSRDVQRVLLSFRMYKQNFFIQFSLHDIF